jgi:hypothetical protein
VLPGAARALLLFSGMGVFNSLGHMVSDFFGPNATREQRVEALGNVFALGVLG